MIGTTLSHYKILDKLGEGGMGVVYLAEDTTLDRRVALKLLPSESAQSQERLERFQREAKTLAALDHPNIVIIHSVEEADGQRFLTMQWVEGKLLAELIPAGGMALERVLEIAAPLADALSAAHEKGVIHRDLKPSNIMVTDKGQVKVLDFGLAKLGQDRAPQDLTELPTELLTAEGRIVGTMPYMSPEQLEGRTTIDFRTDIFSLGAILYEMVTGERAFMGASQAALISAILTAQPPSVTEHLSEAPPLLDHLIRQCLAKDPDARWHSAGDLASQLEWISESGDRPRAAVVGATENPDRKTPQRSDYQIEYFESRDGASIAAARGGSGRPLCVVPAMIDTIETSWDTYAGAFQDHELILYDRRGTGLSERDTTPGEPEPYLQDLQAVIDGFGLDGFDLLGTLLGTIEAAALASRNSTLVNRLVLRSPVMGLADWASIPPVRASMAALQHDWVYFTESFSQFIVGWGNPNGPNVAERFRAITSQGELQSLIDAFIQLDVTGIYSKIRAPTLVEHQTEYFFPDTYSRRIASLIGNCRMAIFSGTTNEFLADFSLPQAFLHGEG